MKINEIKAELILKGISFSDIDREFGFYQGRCAHALRIPYEPAEIAIAKTLNKSLTDLFPDRYEKNGKRKKFTKKDYSWKKDA